MRISAWLGGFSAEFELAKTAGSCSWWRNGRSDDGLGAHHRGLAGPIRKYHPLPEGLAPRRRRGEQPRDSRAYRGTRSARASGVLPRDLQNHGGVLRRAEQSRLGSRLPDSLLVRRGTSGANGGPGGRRLRLLASVGNDVPIDAGHAGRSRNGRPAFPYRPCRSISEAPRGVPHGATGRRLVRRPPSSPLRRFLRARMSSATGCAASGSPCSRAHSRH